MVNVEPGKTPTSAVARELTTPPGFRGLVKESHVAVVGPEYVGCKRRGYSLMLTIIMTFVLGFKRMLYMSMCQ